MSRKPGKKRRIFDIDLPVEDEAQATPVADAPAGSSARRGPMATAIAENADSLRERRAAENRIRAENDALAHEHVRLKKLGLITDMVPLDLIDAEKLSRDRDPSADPELDELKRSIADIGLSNPIRVEPSEGGRFELIQGYRRLSAYRMLLEETGDSDAYGSIPAGIVAQGEALEGLYRRMVDENLVRKDISFAEMADLARRYALDPGTECDDPDKAVALLFKSAGYQKRSYIRAFVPLMELLGPHLRHAREIPRALGLDLRKAMDADSGLAARIEADLAALPDRDAPAELAILRNAAGQGAASREAKTGPAKTQAPRQAKTTFQVLHGGQAAKCTASAGRLELRLGRDFSAMDRRKLEAAIRNLLSDLDE
ncbi:ParB/RepB/Spo0J family partition protein [Oceanomicrobium pacificus]|uniref:ParB N-terminal domain-containing protein n=1 Tax=Oceanomicrobium pacificus TaxID=2692916 RepID=A0A6B0TPQ6_9RHOB|nr:ParB N-terminal domain-containing protein [Oceanomicrobium pacificus]MXU66650.1 ParB N-terminal domain-containing protein [Oceanomicrobium pacificus]